MISRIKSYLRTWYENQISLPHGIMQFVANVAFCQLGRTEYLKLTPTDKRMGEIKVTCSDSRPTMTFTRWPEGEDFKDSVWKFPHHQVIVELDKFQVRMGKRPREDKPVIWGDWKVEHFKDTKDQALLGLKDIFLAHAFYPWIRKDQAHKEGES